ncbi:hypothetical protein ACET3Z_001379 [Daucus carota]
MFLEVSTGLHPKSRSLELKVQEENREFNPLSHGETGEDLLTHLPFQKLAVKMEASSVTFIKASEDKSGTLDIIEDKISSATMIPRPHGAGHDLNVIAETLKSEFSSFRLIKPRHWKWHLYVFVNSVFLHVANRHPDPSIWKILNPFGDQFSQVHFPSWVYDQFSEGKELEIEDATEEKKKLVKKMIMGALCIQMKPSYGIMPPKPFLYPPQEDPAEGNNTTNPSFNKLQAEE